MASSAGPHLLLDIPPVAKQIGYAFGGVVVLVGLIVLLYLYARRPRANLQPVRAVPIPQRPPPAPPPVPPVSFHPQAIREAAKDFDDGIATVLVPKAPKLPSPFEGLPQPTFTHEGERFALGYLEDAFGIWYLHQQRSPVEMFPRTQDGWNAAWLAFVAMEPRNKEKPRA